MLDLFGTQQAVKSAYEATEPFSDVAVDTFLDEAPKALMRDLLHTITAYDKEKAKGLKTNVLTTNKENVFVNIEWCFELSKERAIIPFEVVCDHLQMDVDHQRTRLSKHWGDEIREFYAAYACVNPVDAMRVAKKLSKYVNLLH